MGSEKFNPSLHHGSGMSSCSAMFPPHFSDSLPWVFRHRDRRGETTDRQSGGTTKIRRWLVLPRRHGGCTEKTGGSAFVRALCLRAFVVNPAERDADGGRTRKGGVSFGRRRFLPGTGAKKPPARERRRLGRNRVSWGRLDSPLTSSRDRRRAWSSRTWRQTSYRRRRP